MLNTYAFTKRNYKQNKVQVDKAPLAKVQLTVKLNIDIYLS